MTLSHFHTRSVGCHQFRSRFVLLRNEMFGTVFQETRCYTVYSHSNITCWYELQGTSPTAACQSPKFPVANISVQPAVANCIFCVEVLVALGLSRSPARRCGTHFQIRCVIRTASRTFQARHENASL